MKIDLDSKKLDITCPACGAKFTEKLGRLKNDPVLDCPHCKKPIRFEAAELRRGIKQAEDALANLERVFKGVGKR